MALDDLGRSQFSNNSTDSHARVSGIPKVAGDEGLCYNNT